MGVSIETRKQKHYIICIETESKKSFSITSVFFFISDLSRNFVQIPPNHADVSTQLPPALKKMSAAAASYSTQSFRGHQLCPKEGRRPGSTVCRRPSKHRPRRHHCLLPAAAFSSLGSHRRRLIIIRWQPQSPNASARSSLSL